MSYYQNSSFLCLKCENMKTVKVYTYIDVDTEDNESAIREAIACVSERDASLFDYAIIDKENTVDIFYTVDKNDKRTLSTILRDSINKAKYSKCTKFDKNVKDTIETLKKNCENCLKVNKKCLIKE